MMKPMLSATVKDITDLSFPLMASPKLDGVRALVYNDQLVSRNLKPIPNEVIQSAVDWSALPPLDGELIVGKPTDKDCFRNTTSGVMSRDGIPLFKFFVFDLVVDCCFKERHDALKKAVKPLPPFIQTVPHVTLKDAFELHQYEETMLERGYEGVMLRTHDGPYKFGRSTLREGYLMKLKRFSDSEAVVLGCVEQMHNTNAPKINALGHTERSSHKAGKMFKGVLGALVVRDVKSGVEFEVGSGFTDEERRDLWAARATLFGSVVKYKYFPTGSKDKPRFPVFLGFRAAGDR